MPDIDLPAAVAVKPPSIRKGVHNAHLKNVIPQWLTDATPASQAALKATPPAMPEGYKDATPAQRDALNTAIVASFTSQTALDKATADFVDIDAFARPLLVNALKDQFSLTLDVDKTFLHLRKPLEFAVLGIEVSSFDVLKLPLLQAALHNFEAGEAVVGAFHASSGFVVETAAPGVFEALTTSLTVAQFTGLCRTLDIGAQYQAYLKDYFQAAEAGADQSLRHAFMTAHKDALRAAAELAVLKKDIGPADYSMILSVIEGEVHPWLEGRPVWFRDLSLMKHRMTGCVLFSICEEYRYSSDLILYVPNDPEHPLKRYTVGQLKAQLLRQFTARQPASSHDSSPSAYQRFFSQFVAYADRGHYFSQFTEDAPDIPIGQKVAPYLPSLNDVANVLLPFGGFKEVPPSDQPKQVPTEAPYLELAFMTREGQGIWAENIDLWAYLYDRHRDQLIADAASHAVPTAAVDARVRARKLSALLNIGMLVLGGISMVVPVLGEIMMGVMAGQLLYEAFEGAIEWSEGDRQAAKAHLIDLAQNLALMALMAGAGKGLGKLMAVKAEPVIEALQPVTLPNGKVRLWKPDLAPYACEVQLGADLKPNARGEYDVDGNSYIRLGNEVYQKQFDTPMNRWRLVHPSDPDAYQPILQHNGQGAWRHTLERPLEWSRNTLLRRMGPHTERFTDAQLEQVAQVSGVSDDALRKMHMDHQAPPPMLAETLKLFTADQDADHLVEHIRTGTCYQSLCEYAVPLLVQMPSWPAGEVVEVFQGREPWGDSQRHGSIAATASVRPSIKITRSEVLQGQLPARVLSALDEAQIAELLGPKAARDVGRREQVFRDRLANYARERKQKVFESIYRSRETADTDVGRLQRHFPSLPASAGRQVLEQSSADELSSLRTSGRIPLRMANEIRAVVQQAKLNRGLSGLYRETLATDASDCLALRGLERLPDWPADLRVEVRRDSLSGPLLDSIGREQATARRILVKDGDSFQAFDHSGRVLNPKPRVGRNWYESLVAVLPEDMAAAQASEPAQALQRQLADYAASHREEMAEWLKLRPLGRRRGPSLRLPSGRLGYLASGRGEGFADALLINRARTIYPNLSGGQASEFIRSQLRSGKTDQQVMHLLNNRQREFDGLARVLTGWVEAERTPTNYGVTNRRFLAERVMNGWREGYDRERVPAGELDLRDIGPVPPWDAEFSQVRALSLSSEQVLGEAGSELLGRFPGARRLNLSVREQDLAALSAKLGEFSTITELSLDLRGVPQTSLLIQGMHAMPQLEALHLDGWKPELDVGPLVNLRTLQVRGSLSSWPAGVLDLPQLETLDLYATAIDTLPPTLLEGHERLWRGLQLNWSRLEPPVFLQAYEYFATHLPHQRGEALMLEDYCLSRLQRMMPADFAFASSAMTQFKSQGLAGRTLFDRVVELHQEHQQFNLQLSEWQARTVRVDRRQVDMYRRKHAADEIRGCWYKALRARFAPDAQVAGPSWRTPVSDEMLDLADGALGDLPTLPAITFDHVLHLSLAGARLSEQGLDAFLGKFPNLRALNLNGNRLSQLPAALDAMVQLEQLQLSRNELSITASLQQRLNRMTALRMLDLSFNRVEALNVRALTALEILDLSHTALRTWPAGALELAGLNRLNLSHSALTQLPDALFSDHEQMLMGLQLQGCRLTSSSMNALQVFAERSGMQTPAGIARERLLQGLTGGDPEFYPQEVAGQPDLLLPMEPELEGSSLTPAHRMQRLDPELSLNEAIGRIDALAEEGLGALQIEARLQAWQRDQQALIRQLNGWIDVRAYREDGDWITPADRRRAADRVLRCWRETLQVPAQGAHSALDISKLNIGDLPPLSLSFAHVGTLDVSGVRLTAQGSDGFFRAFPGVQRLHINRNGLDRLPPALFQCEQLTELEANNNDLRAHEVLQTQLRTLPRLERLDLGNNTLGEFDLTGLNLLRTLDLRGNLLGEWPHGVLEAPTLTSLNLSNNQIETIPDDALLPAHGRLMAGTDLSDNLLHEEDLRRLRDYMDETGRGLGFSQEEIDRSLDGYEASDSTDEGSHYGSDDDPHPGDEPLAEQKTRWFVDVAADSEKHLVWRTLTSQADNEAFFNVLSQLRHTKDFVTDPRDLTRRVWQVLQAAYDNPTLRGELFSLARALRVRETCGDGRILLFNDLEIKVYEFDALRNIAPAHKGRELLKLSRGLFRLGKVEELARAVSQQKPRIDQAEIRLAYRLGLAERLGLPRQPKTMLYAGLARVTAQDLDAAFTTIMAEEKQDEFIEQLISRSYWMEYLEERYAAEFSQQQQAFMTKGEALEEQHPGFDGAHFEAWEQISGQNKAERQKLAIRLSRQELGEQAP